MAEKKGAGPGECIILGIFIGGLLCTIYNGISNKGEELEKRNWELKLQLLFLKHKDKPTQTERHYAVIEDLIKGRGKYTESDKDADRAYKTKLFVDNRERDPSEERVDLDTWWEVIELEYIPLADLTEEERNSPLPEKKD